MDILADGRRTSPTTSGVIMTGSSTQGIKTVLDLPGGAPQGLSSPLAYWHPVDTAGQIARGAVPRPRPA
jgi:hypothetical protein